MVLFGPSLESQHYRSSDMTACHRFRQVRPWCFGVSSAGRALNGHPRWSGVWVSPSLGSSPRAHMAWNSARLSPRLESSGTLLPLVAGCLSFVGIGVLQTCLPKASEMRSSCLYKLKAAYAFYCGFANNVRVFRDWNSQLLKLSTKIIELSQWTICGTPRRSTIIKVFVDESVWNEV